MVATQKSFAFPMQICRLWLTNGSVIFPPRSSAGPPGRVANCSTCRMSFATRRRWFRRADWPIAS